MGRPPFDKREKILAAAIDCFSTQSFQDVKLDRVAEQAKVAKGTIYLYFQSKEDLFCECLLHDHDGIYRRAEAIIAGKGTAAARLQKLVDLQAEAFARKGPMIQQMIQMGPTFPLKSAVITRVHAHLRRVVDINSRLFREGIDSGEFSGRFSPRQMAVILLQVFDLNVKFRMFQVPALAPRDVSAALVKLFGHQ
ncbi:MAG: TetR/AcrR family transcriptional regulator [Candidatus Riflebacteria bacterium]|nr:TetR/AcrR family transcriptional regulator [Candidatus Riflebacteria bacterium]